MRLTLASIPMYCEAVGDCLLWNQGCNSAGHPIAYLEGKGGRLVRRYVFLNLMGRALAKGRRVGTLCGQMRCIAPQCLVARTSSQSLVASYRNGRSRTKCGSFYRAVRLKSPGVKLSFEKAREIRASEGMTLKQLAEKYGCSKRAIQRARNGESWPDGSNGSSVFLWRPA